MSELTLRLDKAGPLKRAINAIERVTANSIVLYKEGGNIVLESMGAAKVTVMEARIPVDEFDTVEVEDPPTHDGTTGFPLEHDPNKYGTDVVDALLNARISDSLQLTLDREDGGYDWSVTVDGETTTGEGAGLDGIILPDDLPDLDLPVAATIEGSDLKKVVRLGRDHAGRNYEVGAEDGTFYIHNEGDLSDLHAEPPADVSGSATEYTLVAHDYLYPFAFGMPAPRSTDVTLRVGDEFPVAFEYGLYGSEGTIEGAIAPRVDSENNHTEHLPSDFTPTPTPAATFAADSEDLQRFGSALSSFVDEARIHLYPDAIRSEFVDPANVAMNVIQGDSAMFDTYRVDGDHVEVGLNTNELHDVLWRMPDGQTTVEFDTEHRYYSIHNDWLTFQNRTIDPDAIRKEPDVPDLEYTGEITTTVEEWAEVLPDDEDSAVVVGQDGDDGFLFYQNEEADDEVETFPDARGLGYSVLSANYLDDIIHKHIPEDATFRVANSWVGGAGPELLRYDDFNGELSVNTILAPRQREDVDDIEGREEVALEAAGINLDPIEKAFAGEIEPDTLFTADDVLPIESDTDPTSPSDDSPEEAADEATADDADDGQPEDTDDAEDSTVEVPDRVERFERHSTPPGKFKWETLHGPQQIVTAEQVADYWKVRVRDGEKITTVENSLTKQEAVEEAVSWMRSWDPEVDKEDVPTPDDGEDVYDAVGDNDTDNEVPGVNYGPSDDDAPGEWVPLSVNAVGSARWRVNVPWSDTPVRLHVEQEDVGDWKLRIAGPGAEWTPAPSGGYDTREAAVVKANGFMWENPEGPSEDWWSDRQESLNRTTMTDEVEELRERGPDGLDKRAARNLVGEFGGADEVARAADWDRDDAADEDELESVKWVGPATRRDLVEHFTGTTTDDQPEDTDDADDQPENTTRKASALRDDLLEHTNLGTVQTDGLKRLIAEYGSIRMLAKAVRGGDDLTDTKGIGEATAEAIERWATEYYSVDTAFEVFEYDRPVIVKRDEGEEAHYPPDGTDARDRDPRVIDRRTVDQPEDETVDEDDIPEFVAGWKRESVGTDPMSGEVTGVEWSAPDGAAGAPATVPEDAPATVNVVSHGGRHAHKFTAQVTWDRGKDAEDRYERQTISTEELTRDVEDKGKSRNLRRAVAAAEKWMRQHPAGPGPTEGPLSGEDRMASEAEAFAAFGELPEGATNDLAQLPEELPNGFRYDGLRHDPDAGLTTFVWEARSDIPVVDKMVLQLQRHADNGTYKVFVGPDGERNSRGMYDTLDEAVDRLRSLAADTETVEPADYEPDPVWDETPEDRDDGAYVVRNQANGGHGVHGVRVEPDDDGEGWTFKVVRYGQRRSGVIHKIEGITKRDAMTLAEMWQHGDHEVIEWLASGQTLSVDLYRRQRLEESDLLQSVFDSADDADEAEDAEDTEDTTTTTTDEQPADTPVPDDELRKAVEHGIQRGRARKVLREFGSLDAARAAGKSAMTDLHGVGPATAEKIINMTTTDSDDSYDYSERLAQLRREIARGEWQPDAANGVNRAPTEEETDELPGEVIGALRKLWSAYGNFQRQAREARPEAGQYAEARLNALANAVMINEIRQEYGQPPLQFDGLDTNSLPPLPDHVTRRAPDAPTNATVGTSYQWENRTEASASGDAAVAFEGGRGTGAFGVDSVLSSLGMGSSDTAEAEAARDNVAASGGSEPSPGVNAVNTEDGYPPHWSGVYSVNQRGQPYDPNTGKMLPDEQWVYNEGVRVGTETTDEDVYDPVGDHEAEESSGSTGTSSGVGMTSEEWYQRSRGISPDDGEDDDDDTIDRSGVSVDSLDAGEKRMLKHEIAANRMGKDPDAVDRDLSGFISDEELRDELGDTEDDDPDPEQSIPVPEDTSSRDLTRDVPGMGEGGDPAAMGQQTKLPGSPVEESDPSDDGESTDTTPSYADKSAEAVFAETLGYSTDEDLTEEPQGMTVFSGDSGPDEDRKPRNIDDMLGF